MDNNSGCTVASDVPTCSIDVRTLDAGVLLSLLLMILSLPTLGSTTDLLSFEPLGAFINTTEPADFWFLMYLRTTLGRVCLIDVVNSVEWVCIERDVDRVSHHFGNRIDDLVRIEVNVESNIISFECFRIQLLNIWIRVMDKA